MKNRWSYFIIIGIIIYCGCKIDEHGRFEQWETPMRWDMTGYYAYLPAFFIYEDYDLEYRFIYDADTTRQDIMKTLMITEAPNGKKINKLSIGTAILSSPAFFIAHEIAKSNKDYETDGYSYIYKVAMSYSSLFYLFIGLLLLRSVLRQYFDEWVTAITLLAIALGTNLYFYTVDEGLMTHVYNFTLITGF